MDTKNLNHLFNDDFAELFNEADMEIDNSQESISSYLKILEDEESIQKRLESIQNLAKVIPKTSMLVIDKKILQYLLPAARDLLINIFKEISQTISEQKENETLKILQEYLQMCIEIHEVLNHIMNYVLENHSITLNQIVSLPSNVLPILLITFQHCKASDKVYENYFEELKEIVSLFKATQEVHTKLLKLLENHIKFNLLLDNEIMLLKNFLDVLGEIGEVLVDMNLKSFADNWKSYMNLTQNFAEILNNNSYEISKPLSFFSGEISRNLKIFLNMDVSNEKSLAPSLKLANFSIRVALKLCETFWPSFENICVKILGLFISMYSFFPPFLQLKGCPENIIAQINSSVFVCSEQLQNKLLCQPEFFKVASMINPKEIQPPGFLFFLISSFQKIPTIISSTTLNCNVYLIIDQFFEIIKNSYCELFMNMKMCEERSLYDECVINLTLTILSLNSKEYDQIQLILFKNILQEQIWGALLATDVWCLILRKNSPERSYETLIQIMEKTEQIFSNIFMIRPERIFLENFIQRIYMTLPEEFKNNLVEKYTPAINHHIWKILTLKNFPKKHSFVIESFLINFIEKFELLKSGRCKMADFNFVCNGFEIISTLSEENGIDSHYLQTVIVKSWNFKLDEGLSKNAMFKVLLQKLCRATWNFINYFDNEQLIAILPKLHQILNNNNLDFKIQAIQILKALSSKNLEKSADHTQIISIISQIFRLLLKSGNAIIREASLEVFVHFLNTTPHEAIIQQTVKNEAGLQRYVSSYIQKHVQSGGNVSANDYYLCQKNYKFKHVCVEIIQTKISDSNGIKNNKLDGDEVKVLVERIKSDVVSLHRLFGKISVAEENANEIVKVLCRQVDHKI